MSKIFIHINCASTLDGRISGSDGSRLRISCSEDFERVHLLRAKIGSIMVGANTVIADDPKLTVKDELIDHPPDLVKVVIDGRGRIPRSSRFLRTRGRSIILTTTDASGNWIDLMTKTIEDEGLDAEIIILDGELGHIKMDHAMNTLHEMGIDRILVEGGGSIIGQLVKTMMFDRLSIYYGPMLTGGDGPGIINDILEEKYQKLSISDVKRIGEGFLVNIIPPGNSLPESP